MVFFKISPKIHQINKAQLLPRTCKNGPIWSHCLEPQKWHKLQNDTFCFTNIFSESVKKERKKVLNWKYFLSKENKEKENTKIEMLSRCRSKLFVHVIEKFVENLFCQTEEEELPKDDTSAINKVLGVHVISKFLGSVGVLCQNNAL